MDRFKDLRGLIRLIDEGRLASATRAMDVISAVVTRTLADLEAHLVSQHIHWSTRLFGRNDIGERYSGHSPTIQAVRLPRVQYAQSSWQ